MIVASIFFVRQLLPSFGQAADLTRPWQLVRIDAAHPIELVHSAPVFRLRGRLLPLVDLAAAVAGLASSAAAPPAASSPADAKGKAKGKDPAKDETEGK